MADSGLGLALQGLPGHSGIHSPQLFLFPYHQINSNLLHFPKYAEALFLIWLCCVEMT